MELARKIFGSLRGRRGMVIGAGDMGELTLRCLVDEGVSSVMVASRNLVRAQK
ncbi:MAG: glutamyl-tRNA reductase, partial [Gammaproteobacteria bacterium]|nr:glutamyl-tRNA reductase [Gammaproteobacteria bacterium]